MTMRAPTFTNLNDPERRVQVYAFSKIPALDVNYSRQVHRESDTKPGFHLLWVVDIEEFA